MNDDEVAALDFDFRCTAELIEYDNERHKQLIDALTAGAVMDSINKIIPHK